MDKVDKVSTNLTPLIMPPAVVKVDNWDKTIDGEQEEKLVGEVVFRMVEDETSIAEFYVDSE